MSLERSGNLLINFSSFANLRIESSYPNRVLKNHHWITKYNQIIKTNIKLNYLHTQSLGSTIFNLVNVKGPSGWFYVEFYFKIRIWRQLTCSPKVESSSVYLSSEEYWNNCNLNVEKYHADDNYFTTKCIEIFKFFVQLCAARILWDSYYLREHLRIKHKMKMLNYKNKFLNNYNEGITGEGKII